MRRGRVVLSTPRTVDVRAVRIRLGMTQNLFAPRFGFPLATLRHREHGTRQPTGASLTLLNVIERNEAMALIEEERHQRGLRVLKRRFPKE